MIDAISTGAIIGIGAALAMLFVAIVAAAVLEGMGLDRGPD